MIGNVQEVHRCLAEVGAGGVDRLQRGEVNKWGHRNVLKLGYCMSCTDLYMYTKIQLITHL